MRSAMGLNLSEDMVTLTHFETIAQTPTLTGIIRFSPPPNTIVNGQLLDPDGLAIQLKKRLQSANFSASNVVMALSDDRPLIQVQTLPLLAPAAMGAQCQQAIAHLTDTLSGPVHTSYHVPEDLKTQQLGVSYRTLIGATSTATVQSLSRLASLLDLHVMAINIAPLALMRALQVGQPSHPAVLLSFSRHNLQLFGYANTQLIATRELRSISLSELKPATYDRVRDAIDLFVLTLQSQAPDSEIAHDLYIGQLDDGDMSDMANFLDDTYPNMTIHHTRTYPDLATQSVGPLIPTDGVALGLGLRYFESPNEAFSFVTIKKKLEPIINRWQLLGATLSLLAAMLLVFAIQFGLSFQIAKTRDDIASLRQQLTELETGAIRGQRSELQTLRQKLTELGAITLGPARHDILQALVDGLPEDIAFDAVRIDTADTLTLTGQALSSHDIHQFYTYLSSVFKQVTLSQVAITRSNTQVPIHTYTISCKWEPRS